MAEGLFMVYVANADDPSITLVDGIHCALVNADDGSTDAEVITDAETALQAVGVAIPDGYFTDVYDIDDLTDGPLPDDTDVMVIGPRKFTVHEA